MATNKKIFIEIITKTSGAEKGLDNVGNAAEKSGKKADQASKSFLGLGRTFTAIARGFVIVKSFQLLAQAVGNAVKVSADFELAMKKVKAVTQASEKEFAKLTDSARELALGTIFTAEQVSELQLAYSKLGFTTDEILNATEATLHLATATGEDLAGAADVVGATIRGFGLDASEAARVADVMGLAFSSSALNLENFKQSMKTVAPIARAANIDLETTSAMLSVLADAGLRGTRAATGLKNLMEQLSDPTSALSKELGFTVQNAESAEIAFKKLSERNIDLAKATQLTDKRSRAAFVTLTRSTEKINELSDAYDDATGSIKKMSDEISDTLIGDYKRLQSAIDEAFLDNTHGINIVLREATQLATKFFNLFSNKAEIMEEYNSLVRNLGFDIDSASLGQLESSILNLDQQRAKFSKENVERLIKEQGYTKDVAILINQQNSELLAKQKLLKRISDELDAAKEGENAEQRIKILEKENNKFLKKIENWQLIAKGSERYRDNIEDARDIISENIIEINKLKDLLPPDEPLIESPLNIDVNEAKKGIRDLFTFVDSEIENLPVPNEGETPPVLNWLGLDPDEMEEAKEGLVTDLQVMGDALNAFVDLQRVLSENKLNAIEAENEQELNAFYAVQDEKLARFDIDQQHELDSFVGTQQQKADFQRQNELERLEFTKKQQAAEDKLRKEQLAEENKIAKEAFRVNKANALANIAINTAIAIAKTPAEGLILGAPALIALISASAAAQAAAVAAQKFQPKTFEEGGSIVGPSHSEGGVPFTVGGSAGFEAEGGEYIFSRRTVDRLGTGLLDAINFGGASPRLFADGGVVSASSVSQNAFGGMEMAEMIGSIIAQTVTEIPVVNVATDTLNTGRAVQSAQDMASF